MSGTLLSAPAARLLAAAGTLLAGEAAGFALSPVAPAWPGIALLLAVALLAAYGWGARRLGWILLFALGLVLALRTDAARTALLDANAWRAELGERLVVPVDAPANRRPGRDGRWRVDFASHAGPLPLKVVLPVADGAPVPSVGERWAVDGWISDRSARENRFARHSVWVREAQRVSAAADGVHARWTRLGAALSRVLGVGLGWNAELADLNRAILLGHRDGIPRARRHVFADAGTIHVFAISGLHVMVVAWILNGALLRFGLAPRARSLLALPPLWAYVVLTGAHPRALRAALMASFCLLATAFGRRPDACIAWSLTALAVYARWPERLFDLGCTFSFAVMLGIVLWLRAVDGLVPRVPGWRGWLWRQLSEFGVSLAAWAAGVPIAAHVFGRFTPGGLLASLLVLRCARPMLQLGAGALAAGFVCLPLAALFNNAAAACTWAMVLVSERVAALPFASIPVDPWSYPVCTLWYAGCLGVLLLGHRLAGWRRAKGVWWPRPARHSAIRR